MKTPPYPQIIAFLLAAFAGTAFVRADGTPYYFSTTGTSLLKSGNWYLAPDNTDATTAIPTAAGDIAEINEAGGTTTANGPIGWNSNTNSGSSDFGTIDLLSTATDQVFGNYTTKTAIANVSITLEGATLNNIANTIIANSSDTPVVFENDVAPSGDNLAASGLTTYVLGNSTNVIQATAGSNVIIDNVVTGTGDSLTFLGGGSASSTGATLELGAGSVNDVVGGVAANAPVKANGGAFTSTAVQQTSDVNSFTGGLTIGDVGGTANAGVVQIDGANALPTTGTVTVNANSQLILNGSAIYGGTGQTLILNGTGTGGNNNGALTTGTADTSTVQTAVSLPTTSSVNVQGASHLTMSGTVSGAGELQSVGSGMLTLSGANQYTGGTAINAGSLVTANSSALGTGGVAVSGGNLSSTISTPVAVGGALSLSSGSISLTSSAGPTLQLALSQNFTMSGGTLSLTYDSGMAGSIAATGGTFSITGGTLNLNNSFVGAGAYSLSYDILTGFSSGTISALNIINYDTTDYTASLSDLGVLSFTSNSTPAVPEPGTWALLLAGVLGLAWKGCRHQQVG